ncbi:MAG: WD40 repeat domain-containing protein [Xenococcus sp. (in: cyanobacteria)]
MWKSVACNNTDIAFSPNEEYLATAGEENYVRIWTVATWVELPYIKHEQKVNSIAFSPDSQYIAVASYDKTSVWQFINRSEIARITYNCHVNAVEFSPDGKYIATAHIDGTAKIWLWKSEDLIDEACSRLSRNLSSEEWEQYMGNENYRKTCQDLP